MGKFLTRVGAVPDLILSSPAVRARTTAELAGRSGKWSATIEIVQSFYGGSWNDVVEGVIAVVVPDRSSELSEQSVVAALSDRLARFKQPKRVFIVDALPRNTMGKVQKNILRDTYRDIFA